MFILYDNTDGNVVWDFGEDDSLGELSVFDSVGSLQQHISTEVDENNYHILSHDLYVYEITEKGMLEINIDAKII